MVARKVNSHAILKALNSYWYILAELSNGRKYVTELRDLTERKLPQVSKDLTALRNQRLVESVEEGGRKYFNITIRGRFIFDTVSRAIQATGDDGGRVGLDWKVMALIETLEDSALSEELRLSSSQSLFSLVEKYPAEMLGQERVRGLVETIVKGSAVGLSIADKVTDDLRRPVKELVFYAIGDSEWQSWVLRELYPCLKELVTRRDAKDALREWAVRLLGEVARRSPTSVARDEARGELMAAWFRDDVDPKGVPGRGLVDEIMSTASREAFDQIMEKAKSADPRTKAKAEILLMEFTSRLSNL